MLFVAPEFATFFLIVLVIAWLLRANATAWKTFTLAASIFFYGWWRHTTDDWSLLGISWLPRYVAYLLIFAAVNQSLAWLAAKRPELARAAVIAATVFDLGALFYFKYFEWARGVSNDALGTGFTPTNIILPIGVSFIAFQGLGYVIDVSRGTIQPVDTLDFFTYLFFFPHLVAGPLVRVGEFVPQLYVRSDPRRVHGTRALTLIASGFVKKVIISSYVFKEVVEPVFANPKGFGGLDNLLAAYGYSIQIYCDFSGYTDIAIGLALLLGIQFPQNFDSPYRSITLQDFWRRWHMSLSRWLRDYLYIGLGGNRKGTARTYLNLFLTMFIGGIWHGANWTFIIWGSIHGAVLVAERFLTEAYGEPRSRAMDVVRWFVTFHVVTLAWIFFNARSASVAFEVLGKILGLLVFQPGDPSQFVSLTLVVVIAAVVALQFLPRETLPAVVTRLSELHPAVQGALLGVVMIVCYRLGSVDEFIYFQF
ncbi:MAG: MBOAT family O-acyltransferase [Ilumatobacteraceae bacterium]